MRPAGILRERSCEPVLLLAFRFIDLRRIERLVKGHVVRGLVREAIGAFRVVGTFLRRSDSVVHEPGGDDFIVLLGAGRDPNAALLAPKRIRAIALRIEAVLRCSTQLELLMGWTYVTGIESPGALREYVEHALERGSSESERIDFFAAVGHELRTPLSVISGYIDYLLEMPQRGSVSDTRKALEVVRHETSRVIRFVEAMTDLSMLDFGNAAHVDGGASLPRVIEAAVDATRVLARDRSVTVERRAIPSAWIGMSAILAEQIFINLLENAVKHGNRGGRIDVQACESAGMVAVHISDDGPGIPRSDRTRVFERGVRSSTVAGGYGLGLTFVRSAAEGVGGDVAIDDSPLGGVRLSVRLPTVAGSGRSNLSDARRLVVGR